MPTPTTGGSAHPNSPLEQQALGHLAAGRWRKAREDFKTLCKQDRAKFLPLLVDANVGLAREMLGKRMVSEAQQVVAYLRTIAPPAVIRSLELQMAAHSGNFSELLVSAVALLASAGSSMQADEKMRLADQVVLAFSPVPSGTSAEEQVAAEVRMVHEALQAVSAGQNERALDIVRPIGRNSAFSHWKMFVKGLATFHGGDGDNAVRIFESLPAESVPGRARAAYLLLLGHAPPEGQSLPEPALDAAMQLFGHTGRSGWLARADALWRAQKPRESYQEVREALPSFPSEGLDLSAALSDFYFTSMFTLTAKAQDACVNFFLPIEITGRSKNPTELRMIRRTFCLLLAPTLQPGELVSKWEGFLRDHASTHGYNSSLESLAYGWLGEVLAEPRPRGYFDDPRWKPRLRAPKQAIEALKKSIGLDPRNAAAHLKLCAVYENMNQASERNRLLDRMAERFPENKEVLLRAGSGCLDRKAFVKGIDYFERAIALDRLDPRACDLLVQGCLRLARQQFQKSRAESARKAMLRADKFTITAPENFWRNPWCHRIHRGLLELAWGDAVLGRESLAQAQADSPFPQAFLLFAELAWPSYARAKTGASPVAADLKQNPEVPTATRAAALVRIWQFWEKQSADAPARAAREWLRKYLTAAAGHPCAREAAEAVIDLLKTDPGFRLEALRFTESALGRDPRDPLLLVYRILLQPRGRYAPLGDRQELQAILDEATRRGDQKAVKLARELLAKIETPPTAVDPEWGSPWDDDDDEEDDDDEDEEDEEAFPLPDLSPQAVKEITDMMALLAVASDKEIEELRRNTPSGIPLDFFDMLVESARQGVPFPQLVPVKADVAPPPVRKSVPASKTPKTGPEETDPDQLELF